MKRFLRTFSFSFIFSIALLLIASFSPPTIVDADVIEDSAYEIFLNIKDAMEDNIIHISNYIADDDGNVLVYLEENIEINLELEFEQFSEVLEIQEISQQSLTLDEALSYIYTENSEDIFFLDDYDDIFYTSEIDEANFAALTQGTVTIVFRSVGHTNGNVPANINFRTPGTVALPLAGSLSRPGYALVAWRNPVNGQAFPPGAIIGFNTVVNGTLTLYAQWAPSVVDVRFNGNGHTGGTVPQTRSFITPGRIIIPSEGNMVRNGYLFIGWRDEFGNWWNSGDFMIFNQAVRGSITLYAQWVPPRVHLQFVSSGHTAGSVPQTISFLTPGSIRLPEQGNLRKNGYVFLGWKSGDAIFPSGSTVRLDVPRVGTVRMEAYWANWIWHQDLHDVNGLIAAYWPGQISIRSFEFGEVSSNFNFYSRMDLGKRAWSTALGVPIQNAPGAIHAQIIAVGASRATLREMHGHDITWVGWAQSGPLIYVQDIIMGNIRKQLFLQIGQGRLYVMDNPSTLSSADTTQIVKHEIGHTLGYWGHSRDNRDVMYWAAVGNTSIRANESRHLRQIYDHFRR